MKTLTPYRKAWIDYRKSEDFQRSQEAMKQQGVAPRYARNILMSAFEAGYNSKIQTNVRDN